MWGWLRTGNRNWDGGGTGAGAGTARATAKRAAKKTTNWIYKRFFSCSWGSLSGPLNLPVWTFWKICLLFALMLLRQLHFVVWCCWIKLSGYLYPKLMLMTYLWWPTKVEFTQIYNTTNWLSPISIHWSRVSTFCHQMCNRNH